MVFSALGGCGAEASRFIKRIAEMLAEKQDTHKAATTNLVRTKLAFSVLRSAVLCIRGTRSVKKSSLVSDIDAVMEIQAAQL